MNGKRKVSNGCKLLGLLLAQSTPELMQIPAAVVSQDSVSENTYEAFGFMDSAGKLAGSIRDNHQKSQEEFRKIQSEQRAEDFLMVKAPRRPPDND